jgi:uncharacterized membrane protein
MKKNSSHTFSKAVLAGLVTLAAGASLTACQNQNNQIVACSGVDKANPNHPLIMTRGQCSKLANSQSTPASQEEAATYKPVSDNEYIECYGVAAAGKNDCGTNTTACAGSESNPKAPDAWIAFPSHLCDSVGGRIVEPKTSKK